MQIPQSFSKKNNGLKESVQKLSIDLWFEHKWQDQTYSPQKLSSIKQHHNMEDLKFRGNEEPIGGTE